MKQSGNFSRMGSFRSWFKEDHRDFVRCCGRFWILGWFWAEKTSNPWSLPGSQLTSPDSPLQHSQRTEAKDTGCKSNTLLPVAPCAQGPKAMDCSKLGGTTWGAVRHPAEAGQETSCFILPPSVAQSLILSHLLGRKPKQVRWLNQLMLDQLHHLDRGTSI